MQIVMVTTCQEGFKFCPPAKPPVSSQQSFAREKACQFGLAQFRRRFPERREVLRSEHRSMEQQTTLRCVPPSKGEGGEVSDERQAKVYPLHASRQEVFCRGCVFYAPQRSAQRCRHPQAVQVVKTYVGRVTHSLEPEERNAHNDCPDFQARTWRDLAAQVVLFLASIVGLWTLLLYVFPWVFGR
jgi:hypothetical protein